MWLEINSIIIILCVRVKLDALNTAGNRHVQAYLVFLCFTSLLFVFFLKAEGGQQRCFERVYWHHFFNCLCSLCVSVSQFANSCNISNFLIITISVMVISDQWLHLCPDHFHCSGTPGTVLDEGSGLSWQLLCGFWPLHWPVMPPARSLSLGSLFPENHNIKIDQLITLKWVLNIPMKGRVVHLSL